jgi:Domain of unknown function (DUF4160)
MPTIFRDFGLRFFFYSDEGIEPPHVHIEKGDGRGKYWLDPVEKAYMHRFNKQEERQVRYIVEQKRMIFKNKWHDYFD